MFCKNTSFIVIKQVVEYLFSHNPHLKQLNFHIIRRINAPIFHIIRTISIQNFT